MEIGKVYFISGIDTDAGKTYATGVLGRRFRERGMNVITQKFIQTGSRDTSEDIIMHRRIMGIPLLPEDIDNTTCPVRLSYPASPDLAARIDSVEIDLRLIDKSTSRLLEKYDTVLLEGAGGLMVPILKGYTTIDYIKDRDLPLILVTNPKLGSVNHTLLSLESCRARGIRLAALVLNHHPSTSDIITDDTRIFFKNHIGENFPDASFIEIPYIESADL